MSKMPKAAWRTGRVEERIKARAIRFIEDNEPDGEAEYKAGCWGESFYEPVEFCDALTGRLGAAWRRAKQAVRNNG